jgi:hypothetical protein
MQALDLGAALHLSECGAQHRGHVKDMRDAVALEHVGEALRPSHSAIMSEQDCLPLTLYC